MELDTFTRAYLECALWSSTDNSDDAGGKPLDDNYTISDLAPECLQQAKVDCEKFQADNAEVLESAYTGKVSDAGPFYPKSCDIRRAGHDFWLTRNGHGAGFGDGDWPEDIGERLTDASKAFGGVDLYVGDDGLIYC